MVILNPKYPQLSTGDTIIQAMKKINPYINVLFYSVVVRTVYGDVKGFSVPWHTDDLDWDPAWEEHPPWATRRVNCFLGIPYAQAPLGKYRFDVSML